jgi:hypothetical protein
MSEIRVNSVKGVGATSAAITVNNTDGTCTANLSNRQNKNLIINGDFKISQRSTSSSTTGYATVDRWKTDRSGLDESPTFSQADVTSGTTPYTNGFRKAFKITNGNQTSGAGSGDYLYFFQKIEAQDIAQSGWDYISSSSYVTLSFWVKSSVAQNFYGYLRSMDGTSKIYPFETGALSADTWTKITKTIPGATGNQIDNDNGEGLRVVIAPFWGTDLTASSVNLNQWATFASSTRAPDYTSTWYTTNDATFEITGVQLEVGSVATDFEHRSFGQELALCQRYFYKTYRQGISPGTDDVADIISKRNEMSSGKTDMVLNIAYSVPMRATPTIVSYSKAGNSNKYLITTIDYSGGSEGTFAGTVYSGRKYLNQLSSGTSVPSGSYAHFHFTADAEL